jgi:hypothetical protein
MTTRAANAKSENGTNKSQAIRDTISELGHQFRPRDVIAKLKEQGIEVSPALVTNVMARSGRTAQRRNGRAGTARTLCADNLSVESLLSAKRLIDEVGSVEEARRAIDLLAQLI